MSFNQIVIGSETFNSAGPGKYINSTCTFGGPVDYIRISPGSRNTKTGITTASVLRYKETDVTVGSLTQRHSVSVQTIIQMSDRGTVSDADAVFASTSTFIDATTLTRILNGEN